MRKSCLYLHVYLLLILVSIAGTLYAQVAQGPSDTVTPPPSNAANVNGIFCFGQNVAIIGPQDIGNIDFATYHWYKIDVLGNAQLTAVTGRTYTETTAAPGYYNYRLIVKNTAGCISPISDVFSGFVLPQLNVAITSLSNSICANTGTTVLTAIPSVATGYTFNYQWTRNGINIPGATANTYTLTGERTPTTVSIGVNISYTLNPGCTATGTHNITITPLPAKPGITAGTSLQNGPFTSTIVQGSSVVLHGNVDSATNYQWYKDGTIINGAIVKDYTASTMGSYTVMAFNSAGCPSPQSDGINIIVIPVPAINSVSPVTAAAGSTITISGANFDNTSAVSFGNIPATSYTLVSPTSITAVVPAGAAGNISVTTPGGTASFSGFIFIPPPVIASFTPTTSAAGGLVTITGTGFTGATAVSFGGVSAASFTVVSSTSITAIVPTGATGTVTVTTPGGTANLTGFIFIPPPVITSFTPTIAVTGVLVTIIGTDFTGATAVSFGGTSATSFTVVSPTSITAVVSAGTSGSILVTTPGGNAILGGFNYVFGLPSTNFKLTITSATCKGSSNGSVNITATQTLNYTATITGNGLNTAYPFNISQDINNLATGTYSVCITVAGQSNYQQCYDVVITEPKDLSVYSTINGSANTVDLALSGGDQYNINLNGVLYTTTNSTITLPLKNGNNDLMVATDKLCQGTVQKNLNISGKLVPYPDPFQGTLNLNLGNYISKNVSVEIHAVSNAKLVYSKQYTNESGVLQLDLSNLDSGVYALKLTMDNVEQTFKILKK